MAIAPLTEAQLAVLVDRLPAFLAGSARVHDAFSLVWEVVGKPDAVEALMLASQLAPDLNNADGLVAVTILAGTAHTNGEALLKRMGASELSSLAPTLRYFAPGDGPSDSFVPAKERWRREAQRLLGAPDELKAVKLALVCAALAGSRGAPVVRQRQVREWAVTVRDQLDPAMTRLRHWLAHVDHLLHRPQPT